ncbi:uncharacterized protein H6S33_003362 [Morchella sextelata]|uniref:uncharacterized protein n=1 Tax=Morchella sextelata TaxID=1174677 RepID=UPI001D04FA05|nr:uncharacterized protein H6S33_003362 [Morchella sextelata]KAH0606528.1 hypothetical protein H6S33_003362 [Morchella sextelata]
MRFRKVDFDPCIFIHKTGEVVIVIYLDDILISYWSIECKNHGSLQLHAEFEMTETGTVNWTLRIHLLQTKTGVILSHEAYLKCVLIKYGFDESRPVATPIDNNVHLQKGTEAEKIDDPIIYQSIIGSLMYAVVGTRPDLAYPVTMLSQFSSCPTKTHLAAVYRVLRYLKGTLDWSLFYAKTPPTALIGFSDASYASDIDDHCSFNRHCFMLGEALISWRSYKQCSVATSTIEAEYMALSDTSR